jgi:hypothetical protein
LENIYLGGFLIIFGLEKKKLYKFFENYLWRKFKPFEFLLSFKNNQCFLPNWYFSTRFCALKYVHSMCVCFPWLYYCCHIGSKLNTIRKMFLFHYVFLLLKFINLMIMGNIECMVVLLWSLQMLIKFNHIITSTIWWYTNRCVL